MIKEIKNWIADKWSRFKKWIVFGMLGIGVVVAAPLIFSPPEKILESEIIRDVRMEEVETPTSTKIEAIDHGEIVKYKYISDTEVPATMDGKLTEDVSKRTNNLKFFLKTTEKISLTKVKKTWIVRVDLDDNKIRKSGNKWYKVKEATTTLEFWSEHIHVSWLRRIFGKTALADIDTITSGSGDGMVSGGGPGNDWDAAHDAAVGNSVRNNSATSIYANTNAADKPSEMTFYRAFLPFNTSGIASGVTISSTTLYVYVNNRTDGDNDANAYIGIVETDQPDHTALTTADYNNCGAIDNPDEGGQHDLTTIVTSAFNSWRLDATGFAMIKVSGEVSTCGTDTSLTGWTCLGLREGHDIKDDEAGMANGAVNRIYGHDSDFGANDPYLTIEYSVVAPVGEEIRHPGVWFN